MLCGALPDERTVCNLLVQFAVTLRSESRRTNDHILLSHSRLQGSLFVAFYNSQGYGGDILSSVIRSNFASDGQKPSLS
jgi:hypothetical protein